MSHAKCLVHEGFFVWTLLLLGKKSVCESGWLKLEPCLLQPLFMCERGAEIIAEGVWMRLLVSLFSPVAQKVSLA